MRRAVTLFAATCVLAACDPFGLPATRALEAGAAGTLSSKSFEIQGAYTAAGSSWTVDIQIVRPDREHLVVGNGVDSVEAIVIGRDAYFRGHDFLVRHVTDPRSQSLVQAAGNSWWKGLAVALPALPDLTDGATFRSSFLGAAVDTRTDHRSVGGVDAVELSGARGDVYVASAPPYRLLRVVIRSGVSVDGITDANLLYRNVGADFAISPPAAVLDFGNASTLPPVYTVEQVDTTRCASPCSVAATVRNIGGLATAVAPSTVTFTMSDPVTKNPLGSCAATVQPDVGYNATTTVSCTIPGQPVNAAVVTAVAANPGRG
jgi:hypothetical protein